MADYDKMHTGDKTQKIRADETDEETVAREAADESLHAPPAVSDPDLDPVTGEEVPLSGRDLGGADDEAEEKSTPKPKRGDGKK